MITWATLPSLRCRNPFAYALLLAGGASLSCREPTQVTLDITTNALCPADPRLPTMILETGVVAGLPATVASPSALPNTTTSVCDDGDIGSIVLYPEDGAKEAGVLVIGRLHRDDDPGTVERCIAFANTEPKDGEPPIDGRNCIVARRRVAFIHHLPLRLPIRLDLACAGVRCGPDETCVPGKPGGDPCVSARVTCDETGNCDSTGSGGSSGDGGSGGAGGSGGSGGEGGSGGGDGVVLTLLSGPLVIEHVHGLESADTVYALDIVSGQGTTIYEVLGNSLDSYDAVNEQTQFVESKAMHVADNDGAPVFAWTHDNAVRMWGASFYTAPAPNLTDLRVLNELELLYVDQSATVWRRGFQNVDGYCTVGGGPSLLSLTWAGGELFVGGVSILSTCAGALSPSTIFHDVSGLENTPVAVAIDAERVYSATEGGVIDQVPLVAVPGEMRLRLVHVTSQGTVWVVAERLNQQGQLRIARGTVDPSGNFGNQWSTTDQPELLGGRSLWATDSPAPAAYVVTGQGNLYRLEGL